MKNLLALLLICSTIGAFAQSEYNHSIRNYYSYDQGIIRNIPAVKDKKVEIKVTRVKNGKTSLYTKEYDSNGKMLKYAKMEKGVEQPHSISTYDKKGRILTQKNYRKGNLKREFEYKRDENGNRTELKQFKKDRKLKQASTWVYRSKDCIESSKLLKGDGITVKRDWSYEYYTECDKKKSTLKNGKGKILKEWTYDCKQEGEQLTKKKDVTQVCKWEETDDNYLTKVKQSFDEKGRVMKSVYKYRLIDTAVVSFKSYNSEDQLRYEYKYDHSYSKMTYYAYYNKKGVVKWETKYIYDGDNLLSYESISKGKLRYKSTYEYSEDNLLTALKSYDKDGDLYKKTELVYN